ncbi:caspase-1 [Aethina tumida]|uniref:caspase-1 n=1 Tax=Aethina tumida TaxID=116153 RepID=UPI002148CAA3|nr:caspase-1 [Aethina tumida]
MEKGVDEIGRNGHVVEVVDQEPTNGTSHTHEDEGDAQGTGSPSYGEAIAKMPVPKYALYYKMDHPQKSIAYIFNHENFEINGLKKRNGTNKDSTDLKEVFTKLNFDVHEFKDLRKGDVMQNIEQLSKMDHSKRDCVVVCVLSHGEMGVIYARDSYYKPESLWSNFTGDKCPTLAGKPKIFFIQACQGDKLDGGVHMIRSTETDGDYHQSYKLPLQADFLMMFSTVKGYFSWRNTTHGSWFIQALCNELKARADKEDLLRILTFVSQKVAVDFESNTPDHRAMHQQKQIPCIISMLTRLIQFRSIRSDTEGNILSPETEPKNKFTALFSSKGSLMKN